MDKGQLEDIRQVKIQKILGLKDNGQKVFIKCPIHNERSASMVIFPDGSFHCFGCNVNGQNAIDFLTLMGASFTEATQEIKKYLIIK